MLKIILMARPFLYFLARQACVRAAHQKHNRAIGHSIRGCQRCNFVLWSALNCLNLKWQLVEHVGQGQKRPFWKLPHLICKNDEALRKAEVLACRFDTP